MIVRKIARKLRKIPGKLRLRLNDGRFVQSRFGPRMRVRRHDYTRRIAVLGEGPGLEHYEDVYAEVAGLAAGAAFLDIGANAGLFTLVAAARVGAEGIVLAFEPSLPVFADLVDNVLENGCTNVVPFNLAVGEADARVGFDSGKPSHSGIAAVSPAGGTVCAQVRLDGLADVIAALCGDRPITLKMDVEGAEVRALRAMTRLLASPRLGKAIVEVDEAQLQRFDTTAREIYDLFAAHGFQARLGLGHSEHYNEVFGRAAG